MSLSRSWTAEQGAEAPHSRGLCGTQQQLLLQSLPQLLPPQLPLPQQQNSRTMMMISHRQEQLFPEFMHINVTSLVFLNHSMRLRSRGNLAMKKFSPQEWLSGHAPAAAV